MKLNAFSPKETPGALNFYSVIYLISRLLNFRKLRCLRHKVHVGLFLSFWLYSLSWIITRSLIGKLWNFPKYC